MELLSFTAGIILLLLALLAGVIIDHELTGKTAELVQKYTHSGAIQESVDVYEINDHLLER